MNKICNQDIINSLRALPDNQKIVLAAQANLRGVNIEKDLVPVLTNVANVAITLSENYKKNCELLLGDNYRFLNK